MDMLSRKTHRFAVLALSTTMCLAWLSGNAYARINIGKGIAGVQLGDSQARVMQQLGKPESVVPPDLLYGRPLDGHVGFDFTQRVNDISTRSPVQRTDRRVGPGMNDRAVRHAYPHLRCYRHAAQWAMLCLIIGKYHHFPVETDFLFKGHTLWEIDIFVRSA
jgi:hypothetical protein